MENYSIDEFFDMISGKRGGPLIRACSLIRSNTVSLIVVEAICGRCASFMILTALVSEIFARQTIYLF